jgi:WD40 repeat protein
MLLVLRGHTAAVQEASWNKAEDLILTQSSDGTARLWDAKTGAEMGVLQGHSEAISRASWSAAGTEVVTVDERGVLRKHLARSVDLLKLACERKPRSMTEVEQQRYLGEEASASAC